jgi:NhaP-type Na+/H+ or K+/H+ antiporter
MLPEAGPSLRGVWEDACVLRALTSIAAGALGGMLGNAARRLACRRCAASARADELVVAVPVGATAAAALVGIVAGRKAAFLSGVALGAAFGRGLDRFVPGLGGLGDHAEPIAPQDAAAPREATPPASGGV